MATIEDVRALGYTLGIAQGSVEAEEIALNNAEVEASPQAVTRSAGQLTKATLEDLANAGKLPVTAKEKQKLATDIAAAALEMITTHANAKVEFHQRALEIAKTMPDVWRIEQSVDVGASTQSVVSTYVACKADGTGWDEEAQATLDALAHQASYDERVFQAKNPEAINAAVKLDADGKSIERELGADTFKVDGKKLSVAAIVALADATPDPT